MFVVSTTQSFLEKRFPLKSTPSVLGIFPCRLGMPYRVSAKQVDLVIARVVA